MREAFGHVMWPAKTVYTLLFSKLTESGLTFYREKQLNETEHNNDKFHYYKDIKAEYG